MRPLRAVAFDLDGTLVDSRGDIVASINHALQSTGRAPLPAVTIVQHVGDGARALCARAAQLEDGDPAVGAILEAFTSYYMSHPVEFTRFSPGVVDALSELETFDDLPFAVCTNKPQPVAEAVLRALGVHDRFRVVQAADDRSERKPAPAPLFAIAKVLGCQASELVMVGDGVQDVECARRAGARSIAVVSPFSNRHQLVLSRPDVLIESMRELPGAIRSMQQQPS